MEGITYLERPALGVSLDSGPTEGASCPEPLDQSVLDSSLAARPVGCVIENVLDWEPLRNLATTYTLDSRLMEGITNLERTALGVSLDSRPTEGAPCLEPLEQLVLSSSLAVRPVEGITKKVSDWKPGINPVISYTLDSQLMEGITYLECSALGLSLDSRSTGGGGGAPCLEPLEQLVLSSSLAARPVEGVAEKVSDRKPVIIRFRILTRMVDLWRGLPTRSIWLRRCLWTVDSARGCNRRNHYQRWFIRFCWSHDLK